MSTNTDRMPRRSYALIRQLDRDVPRPELPSTAKAFSHFDEATVRALAYQSGYRAMVDRLVADMEAEIHEQEGIEPSSGPAERSLLSTRVLGEDGSVRDVLVSGLTVDMDT